MEDTISLRQEVSKLYQAIDRREQAILTINAKIDIDDNKEMRNKGRILFYLSITVIVASYTPLWFIAPNKTTAIVIGSGIIIGYIIMFFSTIIDFLILKKDFSKLKGNPLFLLFEGLQNSLEVDTEFTENIKCYSIRALRLVRTRLSNQPKVIESRFGFVLGPLGKLGLLPSILAISITFFSEDHHIIIIHLSITLFVISMMARWMVKDMPRIQFYTEMIDNEIALRQSQLD